MKKYISTCIMFVAIFTPSIVFATTDTFNPNLIISDTELQYWQSMGVNDIDRFLTDKGGYISKGYFQNTDGKQVTTAQMIYDTAKKYQINPKYILVTLQKEQSLITEKTPTQKQLDWATGYGVCDSCSMDDPKIQKFRGFGNQVDYSAGIMRWYYDNVSTQQFIKRTGQSYTISGQTVQPASLATGFLYTYTPHIHGNLNFWKLWNQWFQQRYPNGTLIKGETSPEVYLLQDGKKRKFENFSALVTRFDPKLIVTVPDIELAQYPTLGSIALPNYAVLKSGSQYYLLDYDTVRPFANEAVVKDLGYNPAEIIEVSQSELAGYTIGKQITTAMTNPLGEVVYIPAYDTYHYVDGNEFFPILDKRIIEINFPHLSIQEVPPSYLSGKNRGEDVVIKDGTIIGVELDNRIYVMEDGKKRHIANEEVYLGLGYSWDNIKWVSVFAGNTIPTGEPILTAPNRDAIANDHSTSATFDVENVTTVAEVNNTSLDQIEVDADDPVHLMIRTPKSQLQYIGPIFETDIETYLVYDVAADSIVAGKNIDFPRPPASLQKVVTAYELMQLGYNGRDITTYNPTKHRSVYHRYRIVEGEMIRNEDLLDAFLISSLNTPGKMLVDSTTGDERSFIDALNSTALSENLSQTKFVDVTGESERNITTAREYLQLFQIALQHNTISDTLSSRSYEYTAIIDKDGKPDHFDVHSNDLVRKAGKSYTIGASKTGFLYESGGNIAMEITRDSDNKKFIVIALGNPDFDNRYIAPHQLAEWTVANF